MRTADAATAFPGVVVAGPQLAVPPVRGAVAAGA